MTSERIEICSSCLHPMQQHSKRVIVANKPQENVCVVECQVRGCVCVNATVAEPEPLEVKRP